MLVIKEVTVGSRDTALWDSSRGSTVMLAAGIDSVQPAQTAGVGILEAVAYFQPDVRSCSVSETPRNAWKVDTLEFGDVFLDLLIAESTVVQDEEDSVE
jgi:hypothetical protein